MSLSSSARLWHYDVASLLGKGGMGKVYRVQTGAKGWQDA